MLSVTQGRKEEGKKEGKETQMILRSLTRAPVSGAQLSTLNRFELDQRNQASLGQPFQTDVAATIKLLLHRTEEENQNDENK